MIITQKKPLEEVWQMLEGVTRVALVGCGSCATSCKTGGEPELQEMKEYLEANGKVVTAMIIPSESCQKLLMKKELKALKDTDTQAILTLACGDGVQTVADNANIPVYPATNTMFLGQVERVGLFSEACRMCGDCVLGHTGGICPITKCAKSLVNGPCGGQRNGKCEVNPENNCAWIDIYYRLDALGQLDKLKTMRTDKDYKNFAFPRRISIREDK
ncbi:MAG: methylenetetrahydrofolate reductase C-terminal domain-containing protein [Lachnospiraceae bacterium]|jgi:ferredoxin|nr:methylenetetrahydrofolate reductase C-terminal domain-containing protein [Lachnospiraceae bacterium]MBR4753997.1 methylenetetrahydrofolate reductase C-terminal domain-containing protein [Lachnospiraceae bacterium]MBR4807052.1 methylenetetrahydrofolate reductase C-terminal domain-containing protein [Lachnospiraceae bacterium]